MTPILFASDATDFSTNGIGRLSDCLSCTVQETMDGLFELAMTYPMGGAHFDALELGAIILAKPSAKRQPQAFRIYRITKPIDGRVAIYARHITYQLSFIPVSPFTAVGLENALATFKTSAASDCPFEFETDMESEATFAVQTPASMKAVMGGTNTSFLKVYGGIWEWDNWTAILRQERGSETSIRISYGKNLSKLDQDADLEKTYTAIYPYWVSGETRVELPEKVVRSQYADLYPFDRVQVLDLSSAFDGQPTEEQLRSYTEALMEESGFGTPTVNLALSFVNLADTVECREILTSDNLDLCDIIAVEFPGLGVSKKEQVIAIEWDVLRERYSGIEIGDQRSTLASVIEDQIETISTMPTTAEMTSRIDHATGILNAGRGGHAVFNRNTSGWADELLFMDNENYAQAQKVLRINMNGIGFSSTGYQGPYSQAWTLDGVLSLGGVNNAYGRLVLLNDDGDEIGSFSAAGGLEFLRGQAVGFQADGDTVKIGDFEVNDYYGRQILQSSDERTGISGQPNDASKLYFWANYREEGGDIRFGAAVNGSDLLVQGYDYEDHNLTTYPVGDTLAWLMYKVHDLQDQIDNL